MHAVRESTSPDTPIFVSMKCDGGINGTNAGWIILVFLLGSLISCRPSSVSTEPFSLDSDTLAWETVSLLGDTLFSPAIDDGARHRFDSLLQIALDDFMADSTDLDNIIWLGRRLAYLHRYRDAVRIFTYGLRHHPMAPSLYRHRGHRYITLRDLAAAGQDLTRAARLAADVPLAIEPDGLPNKLNIPLSNLHFNICYHQGLAHFLAGAYDAANTTFTDCLRYANNPDLVVSVTYWLYLTRWRAGDTSSAARLLADIHPDMEIIENADYLQLLLLYKGDTTLTESADSDNISRATLAYGLINWHEQHDRRAEAARLRRQLIAGGSWPAFGYIAAEADSARLRH